MMTHTHTHGVDVWEGGGDTLEHAWWQVCVGSLGLVSDGFAYVGVYTVGVKCIAVSKSTIDSVPQPSSATYSLSLTAVSIVLSVFTAVVCSRVASCVSGFATASHCSIKLFPFSG